MYEGVKSEMFQTSICCELVSSKDREGIAVVLQALPGSGDQSTIISIQNGSWKRPPTGQSSRKQRSTRKHAKNEVSSFFACLALFGKRMELVSRLQLYPARRGARVSLVDD